VFTTLLLADMAQRGEVSLDDVASRYLPPAVKMPERGRPITLRDLATHMCSAWETAFYGNVTISGGRAPVRTYMDELLPDVLEGQIEPGRVFDRVIGLDEVPDGYRAMNEREAIKVMVEP
jgi:CubicO group peptidase (beta-lactamase class C family)